MNILTFLKIIYEGYTKGKRVKNVYLTDTDFLFKDFVYKFDSYERKFILFLSLFVIYKYKPRNFKKFLEYLNENLKNRSEYFKFKKLLKYPYNYIKKDIEYLVENHIKLNEDEILRLYQLKKISFYTFYMLLKNKAKNNISKELIKTIEYVLSYMKIKLDDNWFNGIIVEDDDLF